MILTYNGNEVIIMIDEMGLEISKDMYEKAIGAIVIEYINKFRPYELSQIAESEALKLIAKIKTILDNDDLSDSKCFHRIDEIVDAFNENGIYTRRHDW